MPLTQRVQYRHLEDVIGCKWSAAIVGAVAQGVSRPGELERFIAGISTKVLAERLRRLVDYGILTRTVRAGLPARVDYQLTGTGKKLSRILAQIKQLDDYHSRSLNPES